MQRVLSGMILLLVTCGSANAALLSRAGGQAYYDDVLDITWLANANLADTNDFGVSGINPNGTMTWAKANEWIGAMNSANYLGVNTWRLPITGPVNGSAFNYTTTFNGSTDVSYNVSEQGTAYAGSTGSEMAHLFYNTLNNKGYCSPTSGATCIAQSGWGLVNRGPFPNLQAWVYWSGTPYAPSPGQAWRFYFDDGSQHGVPLSPNGFAWAVSSGDALVPVPAAVWMFGGALGLLGLVRRKALPA